MTANKANDMSTMRIGNTLLILRDLYEGGFASRSDISRSTSLSSSAVTSITKELLQKKMIVEKEPDNVSGVGRPRKPLYINDKDWYVLGVHISGDQNLKLAVFNLLLEKVAEREFELESYKPEDVVKKIISAYSSLKAEISKKGRCLALGLSITGIVDRKKGKCYFSEILKWEDVDIKNLFKDKINIPIIIERDVNALALSEHMIMEKNEVPDSLAVIMVGRGMGLGMIIDGQIYSGNLGSAGEISHILSVDSSYKKKCICGKSGCISTILSKKMLIDRIHSLLKKVKIEDFDIEKLEEDPLEYLAQLNVKNDNNLDKDFVESVSYLLKIITEIYAPEKLILSSNYNFTVSKEAEIRRIYNREMTLPQRFIKDIEFKRHSSTEWARGAASVVVHDLLNNYYLWNYVE
ncbi:MULTISPECIES: ROK family protein [unclassified Halanaerobium]|uniref:ROK family protein n=1 Tax=unclassified Halanaerobium TaxID=2641197 RepID=UPI000DF46EFB|nr:MULTISPECIES: ROK family protein [unclassified Halanaerobium]RCW41558.1 putative NBD/HSP70 family sugar kinase [Halanaerobium sp. MA284_MarDTE_T2]RCW81132.1 putative NBD/HSP70 family sugar kinase [Halanaerobium sp. DL-01]